MSNISHIIKKSGAKVKELGILGFIMFVFKRLTTKSAPALFKKNDLIGFYRFTELPENPPVLSEPLSECRLAWFIPDFGIGSGGHLNIFRMIRNLEKSDIASDIYIIDSTQWGSGSQAKEIISKNFFSLKANVYVTASDEVENINRKYDIAVATSWQTAYYVRSFSLCRKKAYFVQDYEPYFFANGSNYFFAEQTYRFGFHGITAGEWLKEKLSAEHSMECSSFGFSYDKELYSFRQREEDGVKRVFFYARPPTERRGFELGMMALNKLCEKYPDVEVVLAGWDVSNYEIPFTHLNAGVVSLDKLGELYSKCDLALIISFTNLSLLPLEVLASGCPVVTNKGRNNNWIDSNDMFIYSDMDVNSLADTMTQVLNGQISTGPYLQRASEYLKTASWEKEADKVNRIIKDLLK